MKGEIWKDIEGYEGKYRVSNLGRVKSLERVKWSGLNGGCYVTLPERILKGKDNGHGYLQVCLHKDNKRKYYYVHQLVATAFVENPNGYTEVNHVNEVKSDNRAENLEFCNRSYNTNYGTRNQRVAEKKSIPVFSVDKESGLIMFWESAMEAEKCTDISHQNICHCLKGRQKSAGGHYWFYADDDTE